MESGENDCDWAAGWLLFAAGRSEFADLIAEGERILRREPGIVAAIDRDIDQKALAKKQARCSDRQWRLEQNPVLLESTVEAPPVVLTLAAGRPRSAARSVFFFLLIRGYFGGQLSKRQVWDMLADSMSIRSLLPGGKMPGRTTMVELVNAVSDETVDWIHRTILRQAYDENLDDFATAVGDSTACAANSRYPTDSGLILRLMERVVSRWLDLTVAGLPAYQTWHIPRWLNNLRSQAIAIDLAKRQGKRKAAYRIFLNTAAAALTYLTSEFERLDEGFDGRLAGRAPSAAAALAGAWNSIQTDLIDIDQLCLVAWARVIDGQEADPDRVYSASDPDARLIVKGGRQTVFGYRPTIVRSRAGLLTALCVQQGNTADSTLIAAIIDAHQTATGIRPTAASFDDGYANRAAAEAAKKAGTEVSVSGAKGKRQTTPSDWDSDTYVALRRLRPQVESDIHALKARHGWRRVGRRGLPQVRRSLMEGMIVYNLLKLRRLRNAAALARAS